jgi:UDP-N-acetylglucosamine 2-epimerase (non-hydrolysing)
LTLRNNTERPVTFKLGTNVLLGQNQYKLRCELTKLIEGKAKSGVIPRLWDGHAGGRIAEILCYES